MRHDADPAELSPDERTREIAAILAVGLRRLRDRAALTLAPQKLPENAPHALALSSETSVTVTPAG